MPGLQVIKVELGIKLGVPVNLLQKHLPAPIDKLGSQVANEVDKRVTRQGLGYYPAIEYFVEGEEGFPAYLIEAMQEVSLLTIDIVTATVEEVLVPIFSQVKISNVQCLAFSLPSVRPGKPGASLELARHFTPNVVKFELIVSVLQKEKAPDGFEKYADNTVYRWLSETFDNVEIFSARLLED